MVAWSRKKKQFCIRFESKVWPNWIGECGHTVYGPVLRTLPSLG